MKNYILFNEVNLEIVLKNCFKSNVPKNMWSTHSTYNIKINFQEKDFILLNTIKENIKPDTNFWVPDKRGDVNFKLKVGDSKNPKYGYYEGQFDILSVLELSSSKKIKTVQFEVCCLDINPIDAIDTLRELKLNELYQ